MRIQHDIVKLQISMCKQDKTPRVGERGVYT